MSELIAPLIAVAAYFLLKRAERHGYEQGYEDGLNDRRPKHRIKVGFYTSETNNNR